MRFFGVDGSHIDLDQNKRPKYLPAPVTEATDLKCSTPGCPGYINKSVDPDDNPDANYPANRALKDTNRMMLQCSICSWTYFVWSNR